MVSSAYIKPVIIATAITALCSGVGLYVWRQQERDPILEVYLFALKSGRSMFIRTPDDQRILVDGGGISQVVQRLTDIIPFYSRRIDTIIITNTDGKNVSGLIDVVSRYDVSTAYIPQYTSAQIDSASSTGKIYDTLLDVLKQKHVQSHELSAGDVVQLGGGVALRSVFPVAFDRFKYSKANAPEMLFNLAYKSTSLTYMGDASKKVQKYVASSSRDRVAGSDVLVVSHAAAPANMSVEFMNIVQPEYLVYEKMVAKSGQKSSLQSVSKKKNIADPLASVLNDNRFNLREMGTMLIASDGEQMSIKKAGSAGF